MACRSRRSTRSAMVAADRAGTSPRRLHARARKRTRRPHIGAEPPRPAAARLVTHSAGALEDPQGQVGGVLAQLRSCLGDRRHFGLETRPLLKVSCAALVRPPTGCVGREIIEAGAAVKTRDGAGGTGRTCDQAVYSQPSFAIRTYVQPGPIPSPLSAVIHRTSAGHELSFARETLVTRDTRTPSIAIARRTPSGRANAIFDPRRGPPHVGRAGTTTSAGPRSRRRRGEGGRCRRHC
jgi:hypothetical protein